MRIEIIGTVTKHGGGHDIVHVLDDADEQGFQARVKMIVRARPLPPIGARIRASGEGYAFARLNRNKSGGATSVVVMRYPSIALLDAPTP